MRAFSRVLAAGMLLLTTWTAIGLAATSARAEPPDPCDWVADFNGF